MTEHGFDPASHLRERAAAELRRDISPTETVSARSRIAADPRDEPPRFDGDELLIFAANNYLGLADHELVQAAAAEAATTVGTGAGASRLVTGDTPVHRALERDLAATKHTARALVFSSGYAANIGTIDALGPDVVFSDELNHASIIDGCRQAGAETVVYEHCNVQDLREKMAAREADRNQPDQSEFWLVLTDSVFSMDGDIAPLRAICDVVEEFGAWLMVDEAHATGLYVDGGGIVQREGVSDRVHVQMGTLSKALASQGGYVAGSQPLIEYLVNAARSFVFSTGLAPPAAGAAHESLRVARESDRRTQLWQNVDRLREGLEEMGYTVWGDTQILPVIIDDRTDAVELDERLREHGIVAPAIRPPTVPEGTSRIRVAPMATHTPEEIDRCLDAFREAGQAMGLL